MSKWRGFVFMGALALLSACAQPAPPPPPPQVQAQPPKPEPVAYWVSFPIGSAVLHRADQETIHGVVAKMEADPGLYASIVGKADTLGTPDYNRDLSEKRAMAVLEAMVHRYGAPETRIDIRWTGERFQNVPTEDEQAELQNRVVLITLHYH